MAYPAREKSAQDMLTSCELKRRTDRKRSLDNETRGFLAKSRTRAVDATMMCRTMKTGSSMTLSCMLLFRTLLDAIN